MFATQHKSLKWINCCCQSGAELRREGAITVSQVNSVVEYNLLTLLMDMKLHATFQSARERHMSRREKILKKLLRISSRPNVPFTRTLNRGVMLHILFLIGRTDLSLDSFECYTYHSSSACFFLSFCY